MSNEWKMIYLDKLINWSLVVFLAAMSLIVAANVFCRFALNFSLYWADELAQILLVWLTFIGAALAVKEKTHYILHFLSTVLKGKRLRLLLITQQILAFLTLFSLFYFSAKVAWEMRYWEMPATEISRSFVYSACPLGCMMMIYYTIKNCLEELRKQKSQ